MNKLKLLLLVFAMGTLNIVAQKSKAPQVTITGKIIDKLSKEPLEYATVVLKNTKTQKLSGGITDGKGNFNIKTPKGTYDVTFEYISFKSITQKNKVIDQSMNFGVITLSEDSKTLDQNIPANNK